jgi:hypothetical protein
MISIKERNFRPLPDNFSLEELVPKDSHRRRQVRYRRERRGRVRAGERPSVRGVAPQRGQAQHLRGKEDFTYDPKEDGYLCPTGKLLRPLGRLRVLYREDLVPPPRWLGDHVGPPGWRLSGAALDVFEVEPLPAESPLWKMKNVILSPHSTDIVPGINDSLANLFCENLKRYLNGEPLLNELDKKLLY